MTAPKMTPEGQQPPPDTPKPGDPASIPVPSLGNEKPTGDVPPLEILTGTVVTGKTPQPRGRRRTKYQEPPPPPPEPQAPPSPEQLENVSKALGMAFRFGFAMAAAKRGPHWTLEPENEKTLGDLWATALLPYLPAAGKYIPIALAIFATAGVVTPRLQKDAELAAKEPTEEIVT